MEQSIKLDPVSKKTGEVSSLKAEIAQRENALSDKQRHVYQIALRAKEVLSDVFDPKDTPPTVKLDILKNIGTLTTSFTVRGAMEVDNYMIVDINNFPKFQLAMTQAINDYIEQILEDDLDPPKYYPYLIQIKNPTVVPIGSNRPTSIGNDHQSGTPIYGVMFDKRERWSLNVLLGGSGDTALVNEKLFYLLKQQLEKLAVPNPLTKK